MHGKSISHARETRFPCMELLRTMCAVLLLVVGSSVIGGEAWAQHPFTLTTADDVTNHTETVYWIESNGATGFFMSPKTDANDCQVSTTNMPNERMLWYFMDAGIESETQYYYIVNKYTGKYLNHTGNLGDNNNIKMAGSSSETCKFSISGTTDAWLLSPKSGSTYYVNKKGGNVNYTNGLKSSTADDANSK